MAIVHTLQTAIVKEVKSGSGTVRLEAEPEKVIPLYDTLQSSNPLYPLY